MKTALLGAAALAVSSAAWAQQGTMSGSGAALTDAPNLSEEPAPTTRGRDENGERRICRRFDDTVSRMKSRQICLTAREWRERQD